MLPGNRKFTDDDICEVLTEALAVFGRLEDELTIPGDLRAQTYQVCINMVGERDITGEVLRALGQRGLPGKMH